MASVVAESGCARAWLLRPDLQMPWQAHALQLQAQQQHSRWPAPLAGVACGYGCSGAAPPRSDVHQGGYVTYVDVGYGYGEGDAPCFFSSSPTSPAAGQLLFPDQQLFELELPFKRRRRRSRGRRRNRNRATDASTGITQEGSSCSVDSSDEDMLQHEGSSCMRQLARTSSGSSDRSASDSESGASACSSCSAFSDWEILAEQVATMPGHGASSYFSGVWGYPSEIKAKKWEDGFSLPDDLL